MGERQWSQEQLQAISLRNRELLVSAAAGSGKTSVLIERIVRMVTEGAHPTDVDRLLVVTFTKAAAQEMRTRLYDALLKKAQADPANLHIRKQLTQVPQAHVQTIDSFCSYVLKNYFHTIDLDPAFRTAEEGELELLRNDVLENLLEEKYAEKNPAFTDLLECISPGKSDAKFIETILSIFEKAQSHPDPKEWLDSCLKPYQITTEKELNESAWMQDFLENCRSEIEEISDARQKTQAVSVVIPDSKIYADRLAADLEAIYLVKDFRDYRSLQNGLSLGQMKDNPKNKEEVLAKHNIPLNAYREAGRIREGYVKTYHNLQKTASDSVEDILRKLKSALPRVETLVSLVQEFSERFSTEKRRLGIVDFSDVEHLALNILVQDGERTAVAQALAEEFDEIMIDEYQDSNLLQETILRAIATEKEGTDNVFMVGDMKQSIYRFRNACPELFVDKYNQFQKAEENPGTVGQKIELNANYRSRKEVADAVNFFFKKLMHRTVGGIEYTDAEALIPKGEFPETEHLCGGICEILLTDKEGADDEDLKAVEREGEMLAAEINRITDGEQGMWVKEKDMYRHATYRDIVILMRSISTDGELLSDILTEHGIPNYVERKAGFYGTREVQFVLNLLKVIANPMDDIALASTMKSFLGRFTSEDLATIRTASGYRVANGFYGRVKSFIRQKEADPTLQKKIKDLLATLERFRAYEKEMSLPQLLRQIYEETGALLLFGAMPGGDRRIANLQQLIQKATDYEELAYTGVFNFVRYIAKKQELSQDEGEMSTLGESDDLVRIMTIHSSKGLEYPIVFVSNLSKQFNKMDMNSVKVPLHLSMGIGMDAYDLNRRVHEKGFYKKLIRRQMEREMYGEELRLLYVAMTRAKEKCYLTAAIKDAEAIQELRKEQWENPTPAVASSTLLNAKSYIDWILEAYQTGAPVSLSVFTPEEKAEALISAVIDQKEEVNAVKTQLSEPYRAAIREEVEEILSGCPKVDDLTEIASSYSVSALKKAAMERMDGPYDQQEDKEVPTAKALFDDTKNTLTGAARGTLYHEVMEKMVPGESAAAAVGRLFNLTQQTEKSTIDPDRIDAFWTSSLGKRFIAAEKRGREKQFIIALPIREVLPGVTTKNDEETVMVQGVIDMFFEESDGLVLVDYKTDRVTEEKTLIERYRTQLDYYEKALTMITGKRVKERWIYSFALNKEIRL